MTRTDRSPARQRELEVLWPVPQQAARLTLRWEISAAAVSEAVLPREGAAFLFLEWEVPFAPGRTTPDARAEARAHLVNPRTGARLALAVVAAGPDDLAGPVRCTSEKDLHHVEIDGLLSASVRVRAAGDAEPARAEPQLLYARTSLLSRLAIPGGRYELSGADFRPA